MMNASLTSNGTILGIDLGKYKCVARLYQDGAETARYTTFASNRAQFRKLIARWQPQVVVRKACLLAGWVHDLCGGVGVTCVVANTASEAWKFKRLKRKTDKKRAIVALARKLLVRCWAMLRDQTPWRSEPAAAVPAATA
jgi:transposase